MENNNQLNLSDFDDDLLNEIINCSGDIILETETQNSERTTERDRKFHVPFLMLFFNIFSDYLRTFFRISTNSYAFVFRFNSSGIIETELDSSSSYSVSDSESDDDIILNADEYHSPNNNFAAIENENDVPSSSHIIESTDSNGKNFLFIH